MFWSHTGVGGVLSTTLISLVHVVMLPQASFTSKYIHIQPAGNPVIVNVPAQKNIDNIFLDKINVGGGGDNWTKCLRVLLKTSV